MSGESLSPTTERRPDWAALAVAVFLIFVAGVIAWDTYQLPAGAGAYARVGPRTVPYGVAIIMALLAITTAVLAFRGHRAPREQIEVGPVLWVVAGLVLQMALLSHFGFSIATGALFAFTARAFGRGPLVISYPIGVGISLAVWLAFAMGLKLFLPNGPFERVAMSYVHALVDRIRFALGLG
ncbi:tripartite tricarboxylate transporter TctB family protein [soil metagenome]